MCIMLIRLEPSHHVSSSSLVICAICVVITPTDQRPRAKSASMHCDATNTESDEWHMVSTLVSWCLRQKQTMKQTKVRAVFEADIC